MKKEKKQEIIKVFKDNNICISRVYKYYGFIKPRYYELNNCYNNYSYKKERAFNYCLDVTRNIFLLDNCKLVSNGIVSYNIMMFTYVINFIYQGKKYSLYITRDYNTLYAEE